MKLNLRANRNSDKLMEVTVRYTSGDSEVFESLQALQTSDRSEHVFNQVRDEKVLNIDFYVTALIDKPNQNGFRPKPDEFTAFASSGHDVPMLLDHDKKQSSKVGVVLSSVIGDVEGKPSVDSLVSARDVPFMLSFLRGNVKGFSVGISGGGLECSICGQKHEGTSKSIILKCSHKPGSVHNNQLCELFITGATMNELSSTPFPAVEGANIKTKTLSENNMDFEVKCNELTLQLATDKSTFELAIADLKTSVESKDGEIASLKEKADLSFELAKDYSLAILSAGNKVVGGQGESEAIKNLYLKLGVKEAHEILSLRQPQTEFSNQEHGQAGEPEPKALNEAKPQGAVSFMRGLGILKDYKESLAEKGIK